MVQKGMFTKKDLEQLKSKGITPEMAEMQMKNFVAGFPFVELDAPATINNGIVRIETDYQKELIDLYEQQSVHKKIIKFIPASGAASRMFKELFSWKEKLENGMSSQELMDENSDADEFVNNLKVFAFWDPLKEVMQENGEDPEQVVTSGDIYKILTYLLTDKGLKYGDLPKGLLKFHRYDDYTRTPLEEHLVEGYLYAGKKNIHLHFTVSPEHRGRFINHLGDVIGRYEEEFDVNYNVQFTVQKPSTDTMAVDMENKPFREKDDSILFRPGGHGALIQNLNDLDADIIFIKNIDNVVPDRIKDETTAFKKTLAGMLLKLQDRIFSTLNSIDIGDFSVQDYAEFKTFARRELFFDPALLPDDLSEGKKALKTLLNRPIRICGMVKNEGEPGGGPFWVNDAENSSKSLQIVESSQVNHDDNQQKDIFQQSTHFNPVDLVCATRDRHGNSFDLNKFVDASTGFISYKSKNGNDLKAQELPGLWNGSMADWITIFVEVPLITFNPVKSIMDLLREEHK